MLSVGWKGTQIGIADAREEHESVLRQEGMDHHDRQAGDLHTPARELELTPSACLLSHITQGYQNADDAQEFLEAQHEMQDGAAVVESGERPEGAEMPEQANEERVTTPYMTKYERARILGTRALQIS